MPSISCRCVPASAASASSTGWPATSCHASVERVSGGSRRMRILFLTRSFNSLAQRLYLDLTAQGHEVSLEFDISDAVTMEAVALFEPALVIAPFLKRAIPEAV